MGKSVIVIGAGLGGLSAAIHARLLGHEVLVLERQDRPGGKAASLHLHGYRLDPGPSIVILTRIYDRVFRDAGRRMEDYLRFRRLDPIARVLFEGAEALDLPADAEECLRVIRERAPEDAESLRRLLARLDRVAPLLDATVFHHPIDSLVRLADPKLARFATAFDPRATFRQLVDRAFSSPLLRAFFYGFPSYSGLTYDAKAPGALLIPYLMLREGVWWPEGGVVAIPEAFHRLAMELGVEFRFQCDVAQMDHARGRVTRVRTAAGEVHEADAFVCNVDPTTAGRWFGRPANLRPSFSYFTLHAGVPRLVPGLAHHTLLIPKDYEQAYRELYEQKRFPTRPIVYVNATHLEDPSTAPPGASNVFAVATSPAIEKGWSWEQETERARRAVLRQLQEFGVGWSDGEAAFERIQNPPYFERAHGNHRGSLYGPDVAHWPWRLLPLFNRDREFRNLVYVGGAVQPGAGMPMVTLGGRFAADIVSKA
ncbi:MAG: phytoene desaturase family protein [Fimbriimonadales bacterium]